MAKHEKADPCYPFPSRFGENGKIIYSVPVEISSASALETFDIRFADCGVLSFGNWKMWVYYIETTNRTFAFDQRRWLNRMHVGELRYRYRYVSLEMKAQTAVKKNINRAEFLLMAAEEQGYEQAETDDLRDRMVGYVRRKFRKNGLYAETLDLFLKHGYCAREIAEVLSITEDNASFFLKTARVAAGEYYQQYGCA